MGRVSPYVQGQLQSELVGVPQMDNSAAMLSNVLNSTTAALADAGVAFGRQLAGQRNAFMYNAANNLTMDIRARNAEQRAYERQQVAEARSVQRAAEREMQKQYEDELVSNGERDINIALTDRANSIPQSSNLDDQGKVMGDFKQQGLQDIEQYITDSGITNPRVISKLRQSGNSILTSKYGQVSKNFFTAQDANMEDMNKSGLALTISQYKAGRMTMEDANREIDKIHASLSANTGMPRKKIDLMTYQAKQDIVESSIESMVANNPERALIAIKTIRKDEFQDNPMRPYLNDRQLASYEKQALATIDSQKKEAELNTTKKEESYIDAFDNKFKQIPLGDKTQFAALETEIEKALAAQQALPPEQQSQRLLNGLSHSLRQVRGEIEGLDKEAEREAKAQDAEGKRLTSEALRAQNEQRYAVFTSPDAQQAQLEIQTLMKQLPKPTPSDKVNPYAAVRRAAELKQKIRDAESKGYYDNPYAKRGTSLTANMKAQAQAVLDAHSASANPTWHSNSWIPWGKVQGASDEMKQAYQYELGSPESNELDAVINENMSAELDKPENKNKNFDEQKLSKMRKLIELNVTTAIPDEDGMLKYLQGRIKGKAKK